MRWRRSVCESSTCRPLPNASGARSATPGAPDPIPTRRTRVRPTLDEATLDLLFLKARTQNGWLPTPVSDDQLRRIYDIMKMGPTSANSGPARILFLRPPAAREPLLPALSPGNVD